MKFGVSLSALFVYEVEPSVSLRIGYSPRADEVIRFPKIRSCDPCWFEVAKARAARSTRLAGKNKGKRKSKSDYGSDNLEGLRSRD
jgi:hypothetical protein